MTKIISGIICLVMVASFTVSPLKVSANTTASSNAAQIQMLMQLLTMLQAMLAELVAQEAGDDSSDTEDTVSSDLNVRVKYPNGGEEFSFVKGAFVARWDSAENVDLYLMSSDGYSRIERLAKNVSGDSRNVQITVPYPRKDVVRYRLQVCLTGTSKCDISDNSFAFVDREIEVSYPVEVPYVYSGKLFQGSSAGDRAYLRVFGKNFDDIYKLEYSANCCKPTTGNLENVVTKTDSYIDFSLDTYLGNVTIDGLSVRVVARDASASNWISIEVSYPDPVIDYVQAPAEDKGILHAGERATIYGSNLDGDDIYVEITGKAQGETVKAYNSYPGSLDFIVPNPSARVVTLTIIQSGKRSNTISAEVANGY